MDKSQGDLAARLAEVRQEATTAAGGEALDRIRQLEQELAEQSLQVCLLQELGSMLLAWMNLADTIQRAGSGPGQAVQCAVRG